MSLLECKMYVVNSDVSIPFLAIWMAIKNISACSLQLCTVLSAHCTYLITVQKCETAIQGSLTFACAYTFCQGLIEPHKRREGM